MLKKQDMTLYMVITFFLGLSLAKSEHGTMSLFFYNDKTVEMLMLMSSLIVFLCYMNSKNKETFYYVWLVFSFMYAIFLMMFMTSNMIFFYLLFEMSVVPLMFMISYWGYSLERVKAMFYMFLYTFSLSMPFLIYLCYGSTLGSVNIMNSNNMCIEMNTLMSAMILLLMLVKMPLWSLHLWLMSAHVEASTEGSMILASVVLKLSGVAFLKAMFNMNISGMQLYMVFFATITLTGSFFLTMYILRQNDLKLMVAVSSVVHMCFMFLMYLNSTSVIIETLNLVMMAHGLISPLMFLFLGLHYDNMISRNTIMIRGFLKSMFFASMIWFLLTMFNMSLPLTMNFFAEMFSFFTMAPWNKSFTMIMLMLVFFNGLFNVYLYFVAVKGENKNIDTHTTEAKNCFVYYSLLAMTALFLFL